MASGSSTAAVAEGNPDGDSFVNDEEYKRGARPDKVSDVWVDPVNGDDAWSGLAEEFNGADGPKRTIQAAIDVCEGGQVILRPGTYTGQGNRDLAFKGKPIIVTGVEPLDPDTVAATVIDCQGSESEYHRGFDFRYGEDENSLLTGLTITNGCHAPGGAIYCLNSSPTIRHCRIINNRCPDNTSELKYGGGIYRNAGKTGLIADCLISGNVAVSGGGLSNSGPLFLKRCTIEQNEASAHGGGIHLEFDSAVVTNCTIRHNIGRYISAIINRFGQMSMSDTIVVNNVSTEPAQFGRAIGLVGGAVSVFNSTIAYNIGGGIDGTDTYLENTIIWGHAPYGAIKDFSPNSRAYYCNVESNWLPNLYRGNKQLAAQSVPWQYLRRSSFC